MHIGLYHGASTFPPTSMGMSKTFNGENLESLLFTMAFQELEAEYSLLFGLLRTIQCNFMIHDVRHHPLSVAVLGHYY